jgi:hypothetical protein
MSSIAPIGQLNIEIESIHQQRVNTVVSERRRVVLRDTTTHINSVSLIREEEAIYQRQKRKF